MLIEMRTRIGGYRNGEPWPEVGGTIDVPDHEAADLISNGYAKESSREATDAGPTEPPAADSDEESVADTDETAAADSDPLEVKPKRGRKSEG